VIPFVDLAREYRQLRAEIDGALDRVLESGHFVLDTEVEAFEEEFAGALGCASAVGVNSGTDALTIALDAVGVGAGGEVVTVSHSFVSTATAIVNNGASPVFVDIDPDTYCMDTARLEAAVTEDTAAIVPVHLYGHPVEMEPVVAVARAHDVPVVEDACQAHLARCGDRAVGTIGAVGCFSFYPTKNLGAYGDGGAIVTDDPDIAAHARAARNVGRPGEHRDLVGMNSRLDELQAAILREKLPYVEEWNERRREIAARYTDALADTGLVLPDERDDVTHAYHLYVVRTGNRRAFRDHLESGGVRTLVHYPVPIHRQSAYRAFSNRPLPVTERVTDEIVSLPIHPWLHDEEVTAVIEAVRSFA